MDRQYQNLETFQSPRPFGRGKNRRYASAIDSAMSLFQSPRPFGRGKNFFVLFFNYYFIFLFQSPRPFGRGKNKTIVLMAVNELKVSIPEAFRQG